MTVYILYERARLTVFGQVLFTTMLRRIVRASAVNNRSIETLIRAKLLQPHKIGSASISTVKSDFILPGMAESDLRLGSQI